MFNRTESAALTGWEAHNLNYYERTNLIVPKKLGNPKQPAIFYSWAQILELRAIKQLRDKLSLQTIRKVIEFLENHADNPSLIDNKLVVINDIVYWFSDDLKYSDFVTIAHTKGSECSQVMVLSIVEVPALQEYAAEIIENAKNSTVIDFEDFQCRLDYRFQPQPNDNKNLSAFLDSDIK